MESFDESGDNSAQTFDRLKLKILRRKTEGKVSTLDVDIDCSRDGQLEVASSTVSECQRP